jgi:hypothetical protein
VRIRLVQARDKAVRSASRVVHKALTPAEAERPRTQQAGLPCGTARIELQCHVLRTGLRPVPIVGPGAVSKCTFGSFITPLSTV